jgi:enoyl-[acyl-carrier protein] reductase I
MSSVSGGAGSGGSASGGSASGGFLAGKRAVIVGLASNRSIAWGIAQAMHREGAELAFSYQTDKLKGRVEKMAAELGSRITLPLDVAEDAEIDAFFDGLTARWDGFDILVHSVAFAPADQLEGRYVDAVSREGFSIAHDISSYSFAALARKSEPLMKGRAGALLTLTYLGAVRALPSYNVMGLAKASLEANVRFLAQDLGPGGIRVNAISAGPIRTLAASGVKGIRQMIATVAEASPLKRNVTTEDVGNAAAFLCSDLAAGITGQIVYVDSGYNIVGMAFSSGDEEPSS